MNIKIGFKIQTGFKTTLRNWPKNPHGGEN